MAMTLFETGDVSRKLGGLSREYIRKLVILGKLRIVARTPRGLMLFNIDEVETFRAERERRRKAKAMRVR